MSVVIEPNVKYVLQMQMFWLLKQCDYELPNKLRGSTYSINKI